MKLKKLFSVAAVAMVAVVATTTAAYRDNDEPTIDDGTLGPEPGYLIFRTITVTGDVSDDSGIEKVEYRIHGKKRWHEAILTTPETGQNGSFTQTNATFFFRLKLDDDEFTRVSIRVIDDEGVESDYITRRYRYDKHKHFQPTTGTTTPGTGNVRGPNVTIGN